MPERYLEREVKLAVDETFHLPDLGDLVPVGGVLDSSAHHLDSTYFDTAGCDLLAANVTLRRRQGGLSDTGWQLKLPAGGARTELRWPPGDGSGVPQEVHELTRGLRHGRGLRQLARVRTQRTAHRLCDASGTLLLEVADDRVRSATMGAATLLSTWREIEVELGSADAKLARAVVKRLRQAGALTPAWPSKLAHAVGGNPGGRTAPAPTAQGCLGELVLGYLLEQRQELLAGDVELRHGSDAIHHTRVATRRWRSTLRSFDTVFDAARAQALDAELAWYAGLLGAVRDPDVLRLHLGEVIADVPAQLVLGPVANRIEAHLIGERERHRRTLARALNGRRYLALLDELANFTADPPFTAAAAEPAARAGELAGAARRRLAKHLRLARGQDNDELVHRARKAAKRARYAVELATPALPAKTAKRQIAKARAVQDTLGEFRDGIVAAETLLRLGIRAGTSIDENGFSYGLLYALEQQRASAARHLVLD